MEMQKKMAIEKEDFDSAKILKFEIDKLRNVAMTLDTERALLTPLRSVRHPLKDNMNFQNDSLMETNEDLR